MDTVYMAMRKYDYESPENPLGRQIGDTEVRVLSMNVRPGDDIEMAIEEESTVAERESELFLGGEPDSHRIEIVNDEPVFVLMRADSTAPSGLGYIVLVRFCTEIPPEERVTD